MNSSDPALATSLCGIRLRNPVIAASGTFAYGVEFEKLVDLNALGGLVVKGLSREPIEGNQPPRIYETEAGMINSIGLQNIGVRAFAREETASLGEAPHSGLRQRLRYQTDDYVEVVRVLEDHEGLAGYELNVSCPNTLHGGMYFSSDPALLSEVVTAVKRVARRRPVVVKLSPNVSAIEPLARAGGIERRRCSFTRQYVHRAGDRCSHPPAAHWRGFWRPIWSSDQADCAPAGVSGGARGQDTGGGARRNCQRD